MRCSICGIRIDSVEDADEEGWYPCFYEGNDLHDVACPSCMTLVSNIEELARQKISGDNRWYTWDMDDGKLPNGIRLPSGSPYKRNVLLKRALHASWVEGTEDDKYEIIRWYIVEWGGIKGNKRETIQSYSSNDIDKLIALGKRGIASWSKALCIYEPELYPIFDARVSASLNAMLVFGREPRPRLFPCLPSQNKTIKAANRLLRNLAKERGLDIIGDSEFYSIYMKILKNTLRKLPEHEGIGVFTLEMLLFSLTKDLLEKAFPGRLP